MVRAVMRLVLMVLVLAAVLVTATAVGLPAAAVVGLTIITAGLAGMIGLARRGADQRSDTAAETEITGPATVPTTPSDAPRADATRSDRDALADPVVAAMAPDAMLDPESLMPRWRRPSLLAARRADPLRVARVERAAMRFGPGADPSPNRRVIRYALVSLLDRADEVHGQPVCDLMAGDEVEVLDSGGPFWEVLCPDGLRGWVHRTTLGLPSASDAAYGRHDAVPEVDDILTAVLSARGIR